MSKWCFHSIIDIVTSFTFPICFIILFFIVIVSTKQLQSKQKIQIQIKIVYFIAIINAIIYTIVANVTHFLTMACMDYSKVQPYGVLNSISYSVFCLCVLGILLLRLYFTFKESMYKISECQQKVFIILYSLGIISSVVYSLAYFIGIIMIQLITNAVATILFFGSFISAMIVFVRKMYALSILNRDNEKQANNLLYTTTKYVLLLSFAIISTGITFVIAGIELMLTGQVWAVTGNAVCIDCVVNILCLYLQYPFADEYYRKYFVCFGNCCIFLFTFCTKKKAKKRTMSVPSSTRMNDKQSEDIIEVCTPISITDDGKDDVDIKSRAYEE